MIHLDHLAIPVRDHARSRAWYTGHFGFEVESEVPDRKTVALKDDAGFTLFLVETPGAPVRPACTMVFRVEDVEAKCRELAAAGVAVEKEPQKLYWGYGAELRDPDGYLVHVWDERSMHEKGS